MSGTVLLVDDSSTMRQVMKVYLMGRELEFLEAADAARAMLLLRTSSVDLIIADVNMPGTDGIQFAAAIRASDIPNARRLPIIMVTGDKSDDLRSRAIVAGVDAFLLKPLDAAELGRSVDSLMQPLSRRSP